MYDVTTNRAFQLVEPDLYKSTRSDWVKLRVPQIKNWMWLYMENVVIYGICSSLGYGCDYLGN